MTGYKPGTDGETRRITIDLDKPSRLDIYRVWYNALQYRPESIYGRISSGGEGIHLIITLPQPLPYEEMIAARRHLCDDPARIHYDETRPIGKPSQILFTAKHARRAGEWTDEIERLQARYRQ